MRPPSTAKFPVPRHFFLSKPFHFLVLILTLESGEERGDLGGKLEPPPKTLTRDNPSSLHPPTTTLDLRPTLASSSMVLIPRYEVSITLANGVALPEYRTTTSTDSNGAPTTTCFVASVANAEFQIRIKRAIRGRGHAAAEVLAYVECDGVRMGRTHLSKEELKSVVAGKKGQGRLLAPFIFDKVNVGGKCCCSRSVLVGEYWIWVDALIMISLLTLCQIPTTKAL